MTEQYKKSTMFRFSTAKTVFTENAFDFDTHTKKLQINGLNKIDYKEKKSREPCHKLFTDCKDIIAGGEW